jgi:pectate lyase
MTRGRPAVTAGLRGVLRVPAHAQARDLGRHTVPARDGGASQGPATTGGATAGHVRTVTDRAGLVGALDGGSDTPSLLAVHNACDSRGERDLTAGAGWTPVPRGPVGSAAAADRAVARGAGAGRTR